MTVPTGSPTADPPAATSKGGSDTKLGPVGILIIVLVVVFFNVIGMLAGQIGDFLQMMKFNTGILLFVAAAVFVFKGMKK